MNNAINAISPVSFKAPAALTQIRFGHSDFGHSDADSCEETNALDGHDHHDDFSHSATDPLHHTNTHSDQTTGGTSWHFYDSQSPEDWTTETQQRTSKPAGKSIFQQAWTHITQQFERFLNSLKTVFIEMLKTMGAEFLKSQKVSG